MSETTTHYNKAHPFLARIKERYNLCKEGSQKSTFHVVLDLEGSGISYQTGDSIAVQPTNDPLVVETMLALLHANGDEMIADKHTKEPIQLKDYLTRKVNLAEVPKKLIVELARKQTNPQKKERLEFICSEGQRESLKEYQAAHEVWDALSENEEVDFVAEEFCHMLQPLLPRFYSIASSMNHVGNEVHLLIAELNYVTNSHPRSGVCTHYLCRRAEMDCPIVPVYIQPSHGFTVPENGDASMIMIGPGTGVAPYRAFMQERQVRQAAGLNWLFFGEWHRATEFFYEKEWDAFEAAGTLRLDAAFSRDQEHKIYVQHRMLENGKELFEQLESGAYLYVCGDAHRMAKDVDAALHLIAQVHGNLDEAGAKDYVKKLRAGKRYLRDIY
ncbi:MAG TPA: sulfite reductase [Parachlamydiaceae bacterium]|nr:sulfite reductase [Parachlamydiaceae bacterium]